MSSLFFCARLLEVLKNHFEFSNPVLFPPKFGLGLNRGSTYYPWSCFLGGRLPWTQGSRFAARTIPHPCGGWASQKAKSRI